MHLVLKHHGRTTGRTAEVYPIISVNFEFAAVFIFPRYEHDDDVKRKPMIYNLSPMSRPPRESNQILYCKE